MEAQDLVQRLTDYLDGRLSNAEIREVENELARNPRAQQTLEQLRELFQAMDSHTELEPSAMLKQNFEAFLKTEIDKQDNRKVVFFNTLYFKVAAAVLMLILAGGVGYFISEQKNSLPIATTAEESQTVMLAKLENEYSVSQRLIGINEVYQSSPDDELITALIKRMNEDANTNVRMAAIEALVKFYEEPHVKQALINALTTQTDPLVQLELIQILVYKKEQEAVKPLENIIKDDQTLQAVKDEAYAGLFRLS